MNPEEKKNHRGGSRLQKPEKLVAKKGVLKFSGISSPSKRALARAIWE